MNSIFIITPYLLNGALVFDDEPRGITREPFVMGANVGLLKAAAISGADPNRFNLFFSASKFPSAQFHAEFIRSEPYENGGDWYRMNLGENKMDCWLCPVLRIYFPQPPATIWFGITPASPK